MSLGQFLSKRQRNSSVGYSRTPRKGKNPRRPQLTSELLEQKILLASDLLVADPNPLDGDTSDQFEFASLDWLPGSSLVQDFDLMLEANDGSVTGDLLFQTSLNSFVDGNSSSIPHIGIGGTDGGLGIEYEVTLVAQFKVTLINNRLELVQPQNVPDNGAFGFRIYWDAINDGDPVGVEADPDTGVGYNDGTLVMAGDVSEFDAGFLDLGPLANPLFDQFGSDNWQGATSLNIVGGSRFEGVPFSINPVASTQFLFDTNTGNALTDNSLELVTTTSTNSAPFRSINPSREFFASPSGAPTGGLLPEFSYNAFMNMGEGNTVNVGTTALGVGVGVDGDLPDAMFQSDANTSFRFAKSTIHGFKFEDYNNNGIFEPGDSDGDGIIDEDLNPKVDGNQFDTPWTPTTVNGRPRPAIEFQLFSDEDGDGVFETQVDVDGDGDIDMHDSAFTNHTGHFWFDVHCSGVYQIREILPDPAIMSSTSPTEFEITVDAGFAYVHESGASLAMGQVTGRQVFYNDSSHDGNGPSVVPGVDDVLAVDPTKSAFLGTGLADGTNITNYTNGINGITVDVGWAAKPLTADDFSFAMGTTQDTTGGGTSDWTAIAPADFTVTSTPTADGHRAIITFTNGLITDKWLQVTVLANDNTQLPVDDVHYWGNLVGDVDHSGTVRPNDISSVVSNFNQTEGVSAPNDFDRSGTVRPNDISTVVSNFNDTLTFLDSTAADWAERDRNTYGGCGTAACEIVLDGSIDPITMLPIPNLNFGNFVKGSVHGFKFEDYNGDGVYDPDGADDILGNTDDDVPWQGFEFELWQDVDGDGEATPGTDILVDSTFSDAAGEFWFTGVIPGDYVLVETEVYDFDGDGLDDDAWNQVVAKTSTHRCIQIGSGEEWVWADGAANLAPDALQHEVIVDSGSGGVTGDTPYVVFVIDVSGSAFDPSGVDVDGDGVIDSILDAEVEVVRLLVEQLATNFGADANVAVIAFGSSAVNLDMDPSTPGTTEIFADAATLSGTTISSVLATAATSGPANSGTNFSAALNLADSNLESVLPAGPPADPNGNVVFLSDGQDSGFAGALPGLVETAANIRAIGVGAGASDADLELIEAADGASDLAIFLTSPDDITDFFAGGGGGFGDPMVPGGALQFANAVLGSLHGFKYEDLNVDGMYDPAVDIPYANIPFSLYDAAGNNITPNPDGVDGTGGGYVLTNGDGEFWFEKLMPMEYTVVERDDLFDELLGPGVKPSTVTESTIFVGSREEHVWQDGAANLLAGGPAVGEFREEVLTDPDGDGFGQNLMFGNYVAGSIHGFKFEDYNGNGVYEPFVDADGDGVSDIDLSPTVAGEQVDVPWAGFEFQLWQDNGDGIYDPATDTQFDLNKDGVIDLQDSQFSNEDGEFWFSHVLPNESYFIVETGLYDADGDGMDDDPDGLIVPKTATVSGIINVASREEHVWQPGAAMLPDTTQKFEVFTDPDDSGYDENLMFGNAVLGSIHGYKCEDLDADGECAVGDGPGNVVVTPVPMGDVILGRNDDSSTGSIPLGFTFDFFGTSYTNFFINNNGNVTFDNPTSTFTPFGFPQSAGSNPMIAPFFADVDTRNAASGEVHLAFGTNPATGNNFVQVDWNEVGYFSSQVDRINDFTLYIEDSPTGDIVAFFYGDMDWTTGSASGGVGGFGGSGAQIGFDAGDGVNFIDLGRPDDQASVDAFDNSSQIFVIDPSGTPMGMGADPAFAGIPFSLMDSAGNYYDENGNTVGPSYFQLTDANGEFWFEGLMPGEYTVVERVDLFSTLYPNDEIMSSGDSSYTLFVGSREEHAWAEGRAMIDNDLQIEIAPNDGLVFENYVKGSLHGVKFHDVDQDGVYDPAAGDEPFKGVVFELYSDLDGDGTYEQYRQVDEDFSGSTIPAGFSTSSFDPDGTPDPDDLWSVAGGVASSGDLNADETSTITTTVDGFGYIAFDWTVSSEAIFDGLEFFIDGVRQDLHPSTAAADLFVSGTDSDSVWYQITSAGTHTLEWVYSKDDSGNVGNDEATIDNVVFYDSSDANGEFWYNSLIPGDYIVAEYPDAFTSFPGEVMSTNHDGNDMFDDDVLGPAIVQEVNIQSRQELVWAPGAAMLPGDLDGDGIVDDNDANMDGLPDVLRNEVLTTDLAFGNFIKGSIHGFKFEDYNANGVYEPNTDLDPTLPGVQADTPWGGFEFELWTDADGDGAINLDPTVGDVDTLVDTQFSNAAGEYWFTNLLPGDYVLVETERFDLDGDGAIDVESGDEVMASTSLTRSLTVGSGDELVWRDGAANLDPLTNPMPKHEVNVGTQLMFGNYVKGSIHAFKFEDYNADGIYSLNDGDDVLGGVEFILTMTDAAGVPIDMDGTAGPDFQVTTDSNTEGMLWFNDLVPGWYSLVEDLGATAGGSIMTPTTTHELIFVGSRHELAFKPGAAMIAPIAPATTTLKEEIVDTNDFNDYLVSGELHDANLMYGNAVDGSIHGFKCEDVDGDAICETDAHVVIVIDATTSARSDVFIGAINDFPGDVNSDGFLNTVLDSQIAAALALNSQLAGSLMPNTSMTATVIRMADGTANVVGADVAVGANLAATLTSIGFGSVSTFDSNLEDALDLAVADIAGNDPNRTNVYVLSDGIINVGDTGSALADESAALAAASNNVVAFGVSNDALLDDLLVVDPSATVIPNSGLLGAALVANATSPAFGLPEMPLNGVEFILTGTDGLGNAVGPMSILTGDSNGDGVVDGLDDPAAKGEFWFTGLVPGNYTVTEQIPAGYVSSTGSVWSSFIGSGEEYAWGTGEAELWAGLQTEIVDTGLIFGNFMPVDLHGRKFNDLNGDGDDEGGADPGMGGVTIELLRDNVVIADFLTGPGGSYWFNDLVPGNYTVREVQPHPDVVPTTPDSVDFTVLSGDPDVNIDFGNTILGSLHGFKFEDYNGDGVYEPQIYDMDGNPTVDLNPNVDGYQADAAWSGFDFMVEGDFNGDGTSQTILVTTDANGEWWLTADNLSGGVYPGSYTITEILPPGTYATTPDGTSVTVTVESGQELAWTPGAAGLFPHDPQTEVPAPELAFGNAFTGSIQGKVFDDVNGDGVQDAGETPFGGSSVQLRVADGNCGGALLHTVQTAFNGLYTFDDLAVGEYDVCNASSGFFQTSTHLNTNVFVGSDEAVVHKIETTSPANAVIHGNGDDLRIGLSSIITIVADDSGSSDGITPSRATEAFDRIEFAEQIKDIEFVRQLNQLAFESASQDYDLNTPFAEDSDSDEDELDFEALANDLAVIWS